MPRISKEHGFGGWRAKSVRLVPGECLHEISPASGESSSKTSASGIMSEKISASQVTCFLDWINVGCIQGLGLHKVAVILF